MPCPTPKSWCITGGFHGQASDVAILAEEILSTRARLNAIYVKHTNQKIEVIEKAMERDTFMTAEEAVEFGLVDSVVEGHELSIDADDENKGGGSKNGS